MLGKLFCLVWAHKWNYMFTTQAVLFFHCQRCMKVGVDA